MIETILVTLNDRNNFGHTAGIGLNLYAFCETGDKIYFGTSVTDSMSAENVGVRLTTPSGAVTSYTATAGNGYIDSLKKLQDGPKALSSADLGYDTFGPYTATMDGIYELTQHTRSRKSSRRRSCNTFASGSSSTSISFFRI